MTTESLREHLAGTSDPGQGHATRRLTLVLKQLLPKAAPCGEDWASGAAAPAKRTAGPATPGLLTGQRGWGKCLCLSLTNGLLSSPNTNQQRRGMDGQDGQDRDSICLARSGILVQPWGCEENDLPRHKM